MKIELPFGTYDDNFSSDELNCIDQVFSAAADYIKPDLYFCNAFLSTKIGIMETNNLLIKFQGNTYTGDCNTFLQEEK